MYWNKIRDGDGEKNKFENLIEERKDNIKGTLKTINNLRNVLAGPLYKAAGLEIPEEMKNLSLFGDQVRLQLVLSDFLLNVVHHASSPDGWVEIKILPGLKLIQDGSEFVRIQIRY